MRRIDKAFKLCAALRAVSDIPGFHMTPNLQDAHSLLTGQLQLQADELSMTEQEVWKAFNGESMRPVLAYDAMIKAAQEVMSSFAYAPGKGPSYVEAARVALELAGVEYRK